jgi:SAM-dependent methyltransferase
MEQRARSRIFRPRETTAQEILLEQKRTWAQKSSLRQIYANYLVLVFQSCVSGRTLEIGAGSGLLKGCGYDVLATDIESMPDIDVLSDAQSLAFRDQSFNNIVAIDAFHHLERPIRFLLEACRVLKPGGRLVLLEPGITPVSRWFYHLLHREPVDLRVNPFEDGLIDLHQHPFLGNQGLASLLVTRFKESLAEMVPGIVLIEHQWIGSLAYPLSGGFQKWSLVPAGVVQWVLALESLIDSTLGKWCAFRLLITLQRK